MPNRSAAALAAAMLTLQAAAPAPADSASGAPGATATIDGRQLPPQPPAFGGTVADTVGDSTAWWPPRVIPPADAPNILLIILDDAGFGVPSTFGGVIPTDTMDELAAAGLSYTSIHSTALCSPTRAALITGRNHHSVGFGVISEQSTGFPGYNSIIPRDKATIGRILLENGYNTSWFGKDHNTPAFAASQSGPFDQWPTGMGFEYFYGFVGGDANQWQPNLFRNTTQIYPFDGDPEWNLITGMADDAIDWITRMHQIDPAKPFFVKYAPGATHAPHHPTREWVEKIEAMELFDDGYEALRQTIFDNQKKLGLVPEGATLTPWPADKIEPWDQLTDDEKRLFIRQVEVFAAYAAYTDHEIGRVVDAIDDLGRLDDTLVIYVNGDNGTSAEGGPMGTPNEVAWFNGIAEMPAETQLQWYDAWGTEATYNHMSAGWSWAFDTPFDYFKQNANRLGGVRQNMVVAWPNGITDKGGQRDQFLHVIDVVPTLLEVTGIAEPLAVDGIVQSPIEGISFAYTFDADNADAPSRRRTQYFEMMGQWALYHEGWWLSTKVNRMPWETPKTPNPDPLNNQVFELYDLTTDINQQNDLAAERPEKVAELKAIFMQEAAKYQVFPLDASVTSRLAQPRPNITAGRTEFVYTRPMTGLPQGDSPSLLNSSYTITAEIEVPEGGAEGMIVTSGGRFAGYGFYLLDDTIPTILQWDESFDVGSDTLTGVYDTDYTPPFPLTATLEKLTILVDRPQLSEADIKQLEDARQRASD
jgi:arylsulfatase A-like enzyme